MRWTRQFSKERCLPGPLTPSLAPRSQNPQGRRRTNSHRSSSDFHACLVWEYSHTYKCTHNKQGNKCKKKNTGTKDLKCLRPYVVNLNRVNLTLRKLTTSGFTLSGNSLNSEPTSHHSHQSLCLFPEAGKLCAKATGPGGPYFSLMVASNEENTGDQEETHPNTAGNFLQIPRLPVTALTSTFLFYFELLQFNFDYLKKKSLIS